MKNRKALALTLGLSLAVGSLTIGTSTIAHANQAPAGIHNMQRGTEQPIQQEMLTLLQIDEQTFRQEKDSGKSLREIATAHNVARQDVVNLLVKDMTGQIDQGVADKRFTTEQAQDMKINAVDRAQKMVDGLPMGPTMGPIEFDIAQGPEMNGQERPMMNKPIPQEMLKLLKVDEQTFKQEQSSGKSLSDMAVAHNVPRQDVVDLVVKNMNQQIDKRLTEERITAAQATEMKANAVDRAQKMVDGQRMGPMGPDKMHNRPIPQEMLSLLKTDEQTFRQQQSSGKSLADIAATHNVPRQDVVDLVVKDMSRQIDKGVTEKRFTVAQATEMKTKAVVEAQKIVDGQPSQRMNNRPNPITEDLLILLKTDAKTFEQEQSSGKSLAEIAASHNVPRQDVVDLVVKNMSGQIDQGVADKRITAEQATEMKTNAVVEAQKVVDKNMMEQPTAPQK